MGKRKAAASSIFAAAYSIQEEVLGDIFLLGGADFFYLFLRCRRDKVRGKSKNWGG
jgi:hypothetical protein